MDEVVLTQKIREGVKNIDLETALIRLVILRNAMREISDPSVLVKVVSSSPLEKVDLKRIESVVASIEDEELKRELGYLLNLGEDMRSGKLLRDLRSLSELEDRLHIFGYFLPAIAVFNALVYWFSTDGLKMFVLVLTSIILLVCGVVSFKALLSKREILKSFALRYKLK